MDLKDITMEMFSERPTTTTKFSRELIDILANPENTINEMNPLRSETMSLRLIELDYPADAPAYGTRIDHWGEAADLAEMNFKPLYKMIPPTETVTVTRWFETDYGEPGTWETVMWSDPDTGSTRMTGIIHDTHCNPYLVKII
jgi:hypothetical protein|tara:strand:- start:1089 stop:1517 length:429 start_codon:yes stop_codon:yes gene_type:complete